MRRQAEYLDSRRALATIVQQICLHVILCDRALDSMLWSCATRMTRAALAAVQRADDDVPIPMKPSVRASSNSISPRACSGTCTPACPSPLHGPCLGKHGPSLRACRAVRDRSVRTPRFGSSGHSPGFREPPIHDRTSPNERHHVGGLDIAVQYPTLRVRKQPRHRCQKIRKRSGAEARDSMY